MPNLLHKVTEADIQCVSVTVVQNDVPNEYHEYFVYIFMNLILNLQKTGGKLTSCTVNLCISLKMEARKY